MTAKLLAPKMGVPVAVVERWLLAPDMIVIKDGRQRLAFEEDLKDWLKKRRSPNGDLSRNEEPVGGPAPTPERKASELLGAHRRGSGSKSGRSPGLRVVTGKADAEAVHGG